ncbi:unnamed protein product, partial [Choristocarpus tenellus]
MHVAAGMGNVVILRAVMMRWRHEKKCWLQGQMKALDHRRDEYIGRKVQHYTGISIPNDACLEVERFGSWLMEERQRLVVIAELSCEENWRRAVTAKDDKGQTPLHWGSAG